MTVVANDCCQLTLLTMMTGDEKHNAAAVPLTADYNGGGVSRNGRNKNRYDLLWLCTLVATTVKRSSETYRRDE